MGAHVHGEIKIEMAVEGKKLEISIDGPAESFVGFEYSPKTAEEKKAWTRAENLWKKELLSKLFILDKSLGCVVTNASFKQEVESTSHSDIEAEAEITCSKDLSNQDMIVAVKKHYSKIHKLSVVLVSQEAKTIAIKSNEQLIKL